MSRFQEFYFGDVDVKRLYLLRHTNDVMRNVQIIHTFDFSQAVAIVNKGGIDLTRDNIKLQVQDSDGVQFGFDPAMIRQLHNASGLTPVIIGIHPMTTSVPMFLGVNDEHIATSKFSMR